MIQTTITYHCTRCQSTNIVKNGHNTSGNPQFKCKDCGRCSVLEPSVPYTEAQKQHIIDTYLERGSLRAMQRLFGVSPNTLSGWLKKNPKPLDDTISECQPDDILELDELWSYVGCKANKCWLWLALCRRTRQIVAYALGDRSDITATDLRCNLRKGYEQCRSVSDLWPAYAEVFDPDRHLSCAYRGETNHVERFNATLRNRLGRLTRRTLSFSKSHTMHQAVIHTFLLAYNEQISKKLESR